MSPTVSVSVTSPYELKRERATPEQLRAPYPVLFLILGPFLLEPLMRGTLDRPVVAPEVLASAAPPISGCCCVASSATTGLACLPGPAGGARRQLRGSSTAVGALSPSGRTIATLPSVEKEVPP